jgi:hypothetical protein
LPAEDRAADVWEPLVALADLAGGDWPARARQACRKLTGGGVSDEADATRLLADIFRVFADMDKLPTTDLLDKLNADETAPWGGWRRGDGLNSRDLAKMLKPWGISPKVVRVGDSSPRGYTADMFQDAWSRYVPGARPTSATSATSATVLASDVALVADVALVDLEHDTPTTATESEVPER